MYIKHFTYNSLNGKRSGIEATEGTNREIG